MKEMFTIPDRDWFKFIERSEHFFVYTAFAHTDSYMLKEATGFTFPESLYRYQDGLGANYRDREVYDSANRYFLSLLQNNDARIRICAREGIRMNKHADRVLKKYTDQLEARKIQAQNFRGCFEEALDILLYGCTIPYLFLEAADYAKSVGAWREEYEESVRLIEPLRAVSKYFEYEEKVIARFFHLVANMLQLQDKTLARFLMPYELEGIFSHESIVQESELRKRSEWCVFWTGNGGASFSFTYDKSITRDYAFLTDPAVEGAHSFAGTIACRGQYQGKVRIVNTKMEMEHFQKGEVLVSQSTNPNLMPAIIVCGAIITDEGGMASHASIVSRELKKPCIIGTKIATKVLKDGMLVEVDANKGIVKILQNRQNNI